jgi:hypothetical protein
MTKEEQTALTKRVALLLCRALAEQWPNEPPTLRVRAAHEGAKNIVANAKWHGDLADFEARLARLESPSEYEI